MNLNLLVIVLFVIFTNTMGEYVDNYVCTAEYCDQYREQFGCNPVAEACQVQNSTYNGQIFPSATSCGCCEICLINLKYDDDCSVGQPGLQFPISICGPGLTCTIVPDEEQPKCREMVNSDCLRAQSLYDENRKIGNIGNLMQRPTCDGDGDFGPTKCIPGQICYCLDKKGNRIFGESIHDANIDILMQCECSRLAAILPTIINTEYPTLSARCDSSGSYDILQCIDDKCVCVSQNTGSPTSKVYDIQLGLSQMPCYNRKLHHNSTFLRDCELKKMERIEQLIQFHKDGWRILGNEIEMCQPDGYYNKVQIDDTHQFCADKFGVQIENYAVARTDPMAKSMTCNCARANLLMTESGIMTDLQKCCINGNYESVACRRGQCYCVDYDGNQYTPDVPQNKKDTLECYNEGNFCPSE